MSKKGPGKNRKTAAAAATESMAGEFHELAAVREQAEPRAEEFLSFVDFWQRSAGQAASKAAAGQDHATGQDGSAGQDNAAGAEAAAGDARQMGEPDPRETARREAAEIIEQAQSEAAQLKETARQEGRAEGERQGRKEGKKEYAQRLAKLDQVLKTLDGQRGAIIERYRQELLTLVTTLSDRLVHHEVSTNPAVIERCFRDAMAYVVENSLVKVHLNPDDFHRLKEAGLADPTLFGGKNRIQLLEDPAIAAGGCLLKSDFGEVDATLDSARDKLYQAVDQAFQAALGQVDAAAEEPVEVSPPPVTPEEVDAEPQEDQPQQEPEIQAAAEATEPEAPAEPETQATVASQAEPATAAGEPPVAENFPATAEERDEPQSRPEAAVNG
ncbi:MAG: FliH/SctL family protein [Desulfurivibrio sp.]|nr:FliH/SctL family protein [Desulfurivibrio sp.]